MDAELALKTQLLRTKRTADLDRILAALREHRDHKGSDDLLARILVVLNKISTMSESVQLSGQGIAAVAIERLLDSVSMAAVRDAISLADLNPADAARFLSILTGELPPSSLVTTDEPPRELPQPVPCSITPHDPGTMLPVWNAGDPEPPLDVHLVLDANGWWWQNVHHHRRRWGTQRVAGGVFTYADWHQLPFPVTQHQFCRHDTAHIAQHHEDRS